MAVLDASAVLAVVYAESGHETVVKYLDGGTVSAVNWSEVLQKIAAKGGDADQLGDWILALGLQVAHYGQADARETAALYPHTREHGLSLADRACLVLAARRGEPAITADRAWKALQSSTEITLIR